ncbi:MAG: DEAD/DEAH box helicase [Acidimicrobiia bacterium]|nr:DEAD/DEAH box helicase [Acidimicrobiia bacterium]
MTAVGSAAVGPAYPFALDQFQLDAVAALDQGHHVVVAAPTGSGKTVVAEHGIELARRSGRRAFYTAPLKALSNQKFRDLRQRYGPDEVGLLTGDNSIQGDAPVVVMTTEVLRNMIYGRSPGLAQLGLVVLDEVHFLQDTYRGPVWEEVIIHLPAHVQLVCLSATVSNTNELAAWIQTVRGPTTPVIELRRPVALHDRYLVGDRTNDRVHLMETFVGGRPNPDAARIDASAIRRGRGRIERPVRGSGRRVLYPPGRVETVELLAARGLLPAILFIFSRNQCEEAARSCLAAGLRLTDADERARIQAIVEVRLVGLGADDLDVLGFDEFLARLEAGIAAHHAGMVPAFKEAVEACFIEGLTKAVFATETLAVGVNMPARTVVIEKLTKFTGDHHEALTPGEYTQLTGRAGRRGIDDEGHAVVLWSPFVPFEQVAALAASRTFHLRSAFRPTYNMAANLVGSYSTEQAHHLLNLSFAQYQADRDVVRLEARIERTRTALAAARDGAESPYGDIWAHRRANEERRLARRGRADAITTALVRLRPGDVIHAAKGRYKGPVAVVAAAHRKGGMRLTTVTKRADLLLLTNDDFDETPHVTATVRLPTSFNPHLTGYRREVARALGGAKATGLRRRPDAARDESANPLHPVERDPDLRARMRAAGQAERLERELIELTGRVETHNQSLARDFDHVIAILARRGYVAIGEGPAGEWALTDAGRMLARLFHEEDLLVAECLRRGVLDGLGATELAGLLSTFVYEHRSPDPPAPPWFPSREITARWRSVVAVSDEVAADERASELGEHRPPDPGFVAAAYGWVAGDDLADVVADEELTGGDFVRTMKQLVDLARQVALVAPDPTTRQRAAEVADAAYRGVVADGVAGVANLAAEGP